MSAGAGYLATHWRVVLVVNHIVASKFIKFVVDCSAVALLVVVEWLVAEVLEEILILVVIFICTCIVNNKTASFLGLICKLLGEVRRLP